MGRPKKVQYDLAEKLRRIREAGLHSDPDADANEKHPSTETLPEGSLQERIRNLLQLVRDPAKNKYDMIYLVMYDIEDNRVRTHIAKYLLSKGCIRIQKSVYLARTHHKVFKEIKDTLKEVQEAYDNADSILLVPVQSSSLSSMKIIGKDVQIESLIDPPNTLFY
jgi:CRISPR-associated endonuclease Cas2